MEQSCSLNNFPSEEYARAYLETVRWGEEKFCPHCNNNKIDTIYKLSGKSHREGLYSCGACRKQFTVTLGTIFEGSHLELHKALTILFFALSSKSMSILNLKKELKIGSYKSAYNLAKKIKQCKFVEDMPYPERLKFFLCPCKIQLELTPGEALEELRKLGFLKRKAKKKDLEIALTVLSAFTFGDNAYLISAWSGVAFRSISSYLAILRKNKLFENGKLKTEGTQEKMGIEICLYILVVEGDIQTAGVSKKGQIVFKNVKC